MDSSGGTCHLLGSAADVLCFGPSEFLRVRMGRVSSIATPIFLETISCRPEPRQQRNMFGCIRVGKRQFAAAVRWVDSRREDLNMSS